MYAGYVEMETELGVKKLVFLRYLRQRSKSHTELEFLVYKSCWSDCIYSERFDSCNNTQMRFRRISVMTVKSFRYKNSIVAGVFRFESLCRHALPSETSNGQRSSVARRDQRFCDILLDGTPLT